MPKAKNKSATKKQSKPAAKSPSKAKAPQQKRHPWGGKHEKCVKCKGTDRKHYSGGQCTKCYTEARNKRLGIETNPLGRKIAGAERRVETLRSKLANAEAELGKMKKAS